MEHIKVNKIKAKFICIYKFDYMKTNSKLKA